MTALEISQDFGYYSPDKTVGSQDEADEIVAMIVGLSRTIV